MQPPLFGAFAIAVYLIVTAIIAQSLLADYIAQAPAPIRNLSIIALGWLGVALHALSLSDICDRAGHVDFNFYTTSSLAGLFMVSVLLLTSLTRPAEKLGLVIYPLASLLILIEINLHEPARALKAYTWQLSSHILVSMLSYSFLNIAALQEVLVAFQDQHLRCHNPSGIIRSLPPLQTMEKLLFHLIGVGFLLLSISLISGLLFVEDLFAQHLVHKTVLSIIAWFVFGILLTGRIWQGWRGQTAIRWTLGGFLALMLAYFGSKIVLELILNRG